MCFKLRYRRLFLLFSQLNKAITNKGHNLVQIGGGNVGLENAKFTCNKLLEIAVVVHLAAAPFARKKPNLQEVARRIVLDDSTGTVGPRGDLID